MANGGGMRRARKRLRKQVKTALKQGRFDLQGANYGVEHKWPTYCHSLNYYRYLTNSNAHGTHACTCYYTHVFHSLATSVFAPRSAFVVC